VDLIPRFVPRRAVLALALVTLVSAATLAAVAAENVEQEQPPCPPVELLVKFQPGADPDAVAARHGGTIQSVLAGIQVHVVQVPASTAAQALAAFQADSDVVYAEPNGTMTIPEQPESTPPDCTTPQDLPAAGI
jgi:tripartite-type tricarboxylate transporter receptor subunit TctC